MSKGERSSQQKEGKKPEGKQPHNPALDDKIFKFRFVQRWTYKRIADHLGIGISSVSNSLIRSIKANKPSEDALDASIQACENRVMELTEDLRELELNPRTIKTVEKNEFGVIVKETNKFDCNDEMKLKVRRQIQKEEEFKSRLQGLLNTDEKVKDQTVEIKISYV